MDMDMLAKSSLDPIAAVIDSGEHYQAVFPKEWWWSDEVYHEIFPGRDPEDSEDHWQMGQYAFAAVPKHPFLKDLLDEAVVRSVKLMTTKKENRDEISDADILATTGPYLVTDVYHTGRKQGRYTDVLHLEGDHSEPTLQHRHGGVDWHKFGPYAEHMLSHSWTKPENRDLQTYLFPSVAPSTDGPGQGPTEGPGQGPTEEPTDDFSCKGADMELRLKDKGTRTCANILVRELCEEKVKRPDGNKNRASDFCTSCGCGESPPVTTATPTSPPTDGFSCKGDDVDLTLKNEGTKTCFKIKNKKFCNEKVQTPVGNKKRAFDFCTSCGCGGSPPLTTTLPTSPPTDGFSCMGAEMELRLKDKGTRTCANIFDRELCEEKVKNKVGNKKRASDFCTSCGCGGGGDVGDDDDDKCVDSKKKFQLNFGEVKCKDLQTNQCNKKVVGDPDNKKARDYCPQKCEISGCEIENVIGV